MAALEAVCCEQTELVDEASEHITGEDYDLQRLAFRDPWRLIESS